MRAVLFDMDGTLVDSEKLWDISLAALYEELGGRESRGARLDGGRLGGGHHSDGLYRPGPRLDPVAMTSPWAGCTTTPRSVRRRVALVRRRAGTVGSACRRRDSDGVVTNTQRAFTERALNSMGKSTFRRCMRRRSAAWQTRARRLPTGRRFAGPGAVGMPGHRGLGHRHRGGRECGMPGASGAQRCSGAFGPAASAYLVAHRGVRLGLRRLFAELNSQLGERTA